MLTIVPFTEEHIPAFTEAFNQLPHNHVWTARWVRQKTVDDPSYDPELMRVAQVDGTSVGYFLGEAVQGAGWVKAFLVLPAYQRQGIGTTLFKTMEETFAARGVAEINVGRGKPRYFLPGIDVRYTSAIVFLDRLGYTTDRRARVNMDVQLAGEDFGTADREEALQEAGFEIRRATTEDEAGLVALCKDEGHLGWIAENLMALENVPVTIHVALCEEKIRAFATHGVIGPTHFGPMLTAADLRGQGIGSVLLERCLRDWQRAGHRGGEIIWAGPLSFYARVVGATIGKVFWTYHKELEETE